MTGWNLPPGVSTSDLPGNRPDEMAAEAAMDWAMEELGDLSPEEIRIVVTVGKAALPAVKAYADADFRERLAEERMAWDQQRDWEDRQRRESAGGSNATSE